MDAQVPSTSKGRTGKLQSSESPHLRELVLPRGCKEVASRMLPDPLCRLLGRAHGRSVAGLSVYSAPSDELVDCRDGCNSSGSIFLRMSLVPIFASFDPDDEIARPRTLNGIPPQVAPPPGARVRLLGRAGPTPPPVLSWQSFASDSFGLC